MKFQSLTFLIVALLSVHSTSLADRPLDRAEILQIFDIVVSQGRKTWIPAGTIEAIHEEYRAPKTIAELIRRYRNTKAILTNES